MHKGKLEVVCGSMFSGKSEELIRRLRRSQIAGKKTIAFKHSLDNRKTTEYVISHNGSRISAFAIDKPETILSMLPSDTLVVGIDEAQFFTPELVDIVLKLIDKGIHVIAAGLDLTFRADPFGPMPILMALADTVTKLNAVCTVCGADAHFTQRLVNGKPALYNDPIILVGAEEAYQARCRGCFYIDKYTTWHTTQI